MTVDALCLASVSPALAIGEPLRPVHAGRLYPAKIDVRVLLHHRRRPAQRNAEDRDAAFVRKARRWLGALWETISSDLPLGGGRP